MIGLARAGESLPFLIIGRNVLLKIGGMQKMVVERREYLVLDQIQAKFPGVVTGPALSRRRAGDPNCTALAVMDRHATPAAPTFQKARERSGWRPGRFSGRLGVGWPRETLLDSVPEFLVDDPQMRHLGVFPFLSSLYTADPLSGDWIEHHPDPVPDKDAGVDSVAKDTIASIGAAVQRGGVPLCASRRQDTLCLEIVGDLPRGGTAGVFMENPPDHIGFIRFNLKLARSSRDRCVTIRLSTTA
ncbi:hypothetical protein V8324_07585 [Roseovarius sp. D22-M7]